MRRFLVTLVLGAFLALVGVQSVHAHDASAAPADSCAVCALAQQAQRQAPSHAPSVVRVETCAAFVSVVALPSGIRLAARACARAPPRAS